MSHWSRRNEFAGLKGTGFSPYMESAKQLGFSP